jgi:hypothetical protein
MIKNREKLQRHLLHEVLDPVVDEALSHELAVKERWQSVADCFVTLYSKAVIMSNYPIIEGCRSTLEKVGYTDPTNAMLMHWMAEEAE